MVKEDEGGVQENTERTGGAEETLWLSECKRSVIQIEMM